MGHTLSDAMVASYREAGVVFPLPALAAADTPKVLQALAQLCRSRRASRP